MNYFKRISICFLTVAILITHFNFLNPTIVDASYKVSFKIHSEVAYLLNLDTGTVLYEKDSDVQMYPASMTKVMTALVAIENCDDLENTIVTAPSYIFDEFVGVNISNADIRHGEEVRMIDLIYALILASACEAASIIADYIGGGDIQVFVDMMNAKAQEIGAYDTNFGNSHGLFHPEQFTTCRDMSLIAQAAMDHPIFEKIASTSSYLMPTTNKHSEERYVTHTNYMMSPTRGGAYYYPGVIGIKTGYITEVGRNLVSMASRNGYNYLIVTMGASLTDENGNYYPSGTNKAFEDHIALYDWAFDSFETQVILKKGDILEEVSVSFGAKQDFVTLEAARDVTALLPINAEASTILKEPILLAEEVIAPIQQGAILGKLELKVQNESFAIVDLVAVETVYRNEAQFKMSFFANFFNKPHVIGMLFLLGFLIICYIMLLIRYQRLKSRKAQRRYRNSYAVNDGEM